MKIKSGIKTRIRIQLALGRSLRPEFLFLLIVISIILIWRDHSVDPVIQSVHPSTELTQPDAQARVPIDPLMSSPPVPAPHPSA